MGLQFAKKETMMIVRQILSAKPNASILSVPPTASVKEAVELLSVHKIGALMVFSGTKELLGILSERDVVRELGRSGPEALLSQVSEFMTKTVISCAPSDTAVSVLGKMTEGRFRHMPVIEDDQVIGVISIGDVVKARIEEVEHENSALTEMIAGH